MQVKCPHCHTTIQLDVEETIVEEILCKTCGSTFRIAQDRTPTYVADSRQLGKFQLLERVGAGAFGAVWKARDTKLDRLVAVKMPHTGRVLSEEGAERFLREGRSAAQLRHPGIVSLHEVGQHQGMPYLVADYIEGLTLSDLLTARRLTFHEAAELTAQVADALHYAHSMGVVHRDIKPSNIMLERSGVKPAGGDSAAPVPLGKPMLMDFGLALREETDVTMTLDGQVLGTPAYMSPEQAGGLSHKVDARSDVYCLGVVLYQLLVGELPFRGNSRMLLDQVLREEPRAPRRLNDRIPRDLETIALKCLAKEPARRYESAGELAAELRRWLAGEPIQARPVGKLERGWGWSKRNPRVAGLSAAVLLLLVAVSVGSTLAALRIAAAKAQATRRLRQARESADTLLSSVSEALQDVPGAGRFRRQLLEKAAEAYEQLASEQSDDPDLQLESGWAFHRLGRVRRILGDLAGAEQSLRAAESIFDGLLARRQKTSDCRNGLATSRADLGLVLSELDQCDVAQRVYQQAIIDYEALVAGEPDVADHRFNLGGVRVNLGLLLGRIGRHEDARAHLGRATDEFVKLVETSSGDPRYRFALAAARDDLGQQFSIIGQSEQAVAAYRSAIDEYESLVLAAPAVPKYREGLATSRFNLGNDLRVLGRYCDAEQVYRSAIADYDALVRADRDVPRFREGRAFALNNLGGVLLALENHRDALDVLEVAAAEFAALVDADRAVAIYREGLATSRTLLGQVQRGLGRLTDAEQHFRAALDDYAALVASARGVPSYREGLAICRSNLGQVLQKLGQPEPAREAYRQAIVVLETLLSVEPDVPSYRDSLAWSSTHLGELLHASGQTDAANRAFARALAERERLATQFPAVPEYQHRLAGLLTNCPDANFRDAARAVEAATHAVRMAHDNAAYWSTLGAAQYRAQAWRECIAALDRSDELRSGRESLDGFYRAMACWQLGEQQQALERYAQAVEWMDKNKPDDEQWTALRAEAAALLGRPTQPDPPSRAPASRGSYR